MIAGDVFGDSDRAATMGCAQRPCGGAAPRWVARACGQRPVCGPLPLVAAGFQVRQAATPCRRKHLTQGQHVPIRQRLADRRRKAMWHS